MKNNLIAKFLGMVLVLLNVVLNAQGVPPPPPQEESGDIGGITQPIDAYVVYLAVFAIVMTIYYVKKNKTKIAQLNV